MPSRGSSCGLALSAFALFSAAAGPARAYTDEEWRGAYQYMLVSGGAPGPNERAAVEAFIRETLPGDHAMQLRRCVANGRELLFVRGFGRIVSVVATQIADSTHLGKGESAKIGDTLRESFSHLTFSAGQGASRNHGGEINVGLGDISHGHAATKFTLYHEVGHAVWSALYEHHQALLAELATNLERLPAKHRLEYFADTLAVRVMKREAEKQGAVIDAALYLFKSEGESDTHPRGTGRVKHVKAVYAVSR